MVLHACRVEMGRAGVQKGVGLQIREQRLPTPFSFLSNLTKGESEWRIMCLVNGHRSGIQLAEQYESFLLREATLVCFDRSTVE